MIKKKNTLAVSPPLEMKSARTVHTVAAKETMFSITRQYGITVYQLREWNNLITDELKIGQTLYVAQPIYNQTQTATTTPPVTSQTATVQIQTPPPVVVTPIEPTPTIKISEGVRGSDEIIESGLAELIEGTEGNRKYLALASYRSRSVQFSESKMK